jgi:peptide/nickel transport system permease protein
MNRSVFRRVWRSRTGRIGIAILAIHVAIAVLAPLLAPFSTTKIDPINAFAEPSWPHLFGTDQYGRDILSRVIYGGRTAIVIALVSTTIGVSFGSLLGLYLGVTRGIADEITTRLSDALFAIPSLLLLLMMMTLFGGGVTVIIIVLAGFKIAPVARVIRGQALDLVGRDFIVAAKLRGESNLAIIRRELLPHALDVMLVEFAMRSSWTVMAIAGLSFLGFGVSPPTADWGLMVSENRSMLQISPWGTLFPIAAIASLVIGLNLAADVLAKALGIDRSSEVPA